MKNCIFLSSFIIVLLFAFTGERFQGPWKAPREVDSLYNPYNIEPLTLPQGQEVYNLYCASCHGKTGKGDGLDVNKLKVKPISFQADQSRLQSDGSLFWKISNGRNEMPGFKNDLSEEQKWQLVEYIRDLSKPFDDQMNPFKVEH